VSVESEIYTRLTTFAGLMALISDRVYPNLLPQEPTYPAISYRRVTADRPHAMGVDAGVVFARFQFDVWDEDDEAGDAGYDSAKAVAEQVRLALQRWRTTADTIVQDTLFLTEQDLYEDELKVHHIAMDFQIIYEE